MYGFLVWKDHAITPERTYQIAQNSDGTITLAPSGTVVQQGTNMNAANFNNLEQGVFAANLSASEALRLIHGLQDKTQALEGLILQNTLTNSSKYPFNNSTKTIAFGNDNERYNTDYTVIVEATPVDGFVGDIKITDKLLNGFKIQYTGSASALQVKCYIQGGR